MVCDIISEFVNTVKTSVTLIIIAIIIIVIIVAVKAFSERMNDKERQRQQNEREKENEIRRRENEAALEKRRNMYWNNLYLVYGDKDHNTLVTVLDWIEEFNRLPQIGEDGYNMQVSHERHVCRENIKKLLGYPKWYVEDNNASETPIWLDLDIKYVKMILK